MKLRPYQEDIAQQANAILHTYWLCYITAQVRTWKTLMALQTAMLYGAKSVLFVTKKKAISSIQDDYKAMGYLFDITVINYESIHKVSWIFDFLILDEAHGSLAWFPKPSVSHKEIKKRFSFLPMIFLSGTPIVESGCKIFHTLWVSDNSPFKSSRNFYKWFALYGIPKKVYTAYGEAISYDSCHIDKILEDINHIIITFTQENAWFSTEITEHILKVPMKKTTYDIVTTLVNNKVMEWRQWVILADTGVKLQICLHQIFSGTIKLEWWEAIILDDTKALYVRNYFKNMKIAIFYCFVKELELLQQVFGDTITTNLEEFNTTDKNYIGQIVSTREWVNLSSADALVFYNIPFSWTSYLQGRDRMSHKERKVNNVYFICSEWWIEEKILRVVRGKKNYSEKIFQKDLKYYIW